MPSNPTPQGISRLLKTAGFDRSEVLPRWRGEPDRYTAGFYVRGDADKAYVNWRPKAPLLTPSPAQADRDRVTALEMADRYAEAIRAAGWAAEVIHLSGPVVRVSAKED
jgi:hypothetical protein